MESVKNESSIQEESLSVEGSSVIPLSTIIRELSVGKFDPESPLRIKIRRSHVWQDTLFKLKRCSENDINKLIKVQFIGEPAVDEGGPRNEYFSLLHREMASSSLFVGEPGSKCFNHNIIALEQKEYLFMVSCVHWVFFNIRPHHVFFSSSVVDYIVYGKLEMYLHVLKMYQMQRLRKSWENCKVFPIQTSSSKWPHLIVRFDLKLDTQNLL